MLKSKQNIKVMQKNAISMSLDEVRAWYLAEISKTVGYSNEEIFRNSCRIDSDYARMIYESCLSAPEDLKHYLRNEKAARGYCLRCWGRFPQSVRSAGGMQACVVKSSVL